MKYYKHNNGHDYLKIVCMESKMGHFSRNLKGIDGKYCYQLCDASLIMLDADILKMHWIEITESEYKVSILFLANIFSGMLKRIEASM